MADLEHRPEAIPGPQAAIGQTLPGFAGLAQEERQAHDLRNTPWDALTLQQMMNRTREVVKEIERTLRWHSTRLQQLSERLDALAEHVHSDGKVMVPVDSRMRGQGYGIDALEKRVEGWF